MKTTRENSYSRRDFIRGSLISMAGISLLPLNSCIKPGDTVTLGFIGLGRQADFLLHSFLKINGVRVIAGADVYAVKRERFKIKADTFYKESGINHTVKVFEDYRSILDDKSIDAVIIATPDHWHAIMAINACKAGKDIYLEKPLTFTIKEGIEVVNAVRSSGRIMAVGSQQRSDSGFQHAVKSVQEGKIGQLEKVLVFNGMNQHPLPYTLPEEPVPDGLDWKTWLGPLPYYHFNKELNPPVSVNPIVDEKIWGGWRWYKEFGGGLLTDWGAHMVDIAQWGMGFDLSGPVRIIPAGHENNEFLTYVYSNGLHLSHQAFNGDMRGVKFMGSDGWIEVARGFFNSSDETLKPAIQHEDVPYEGRSGHLENFIESVKAHKDPVVPVEIGHRTCTACTLGNIAYELNRPVEWDPEKESFVNDPEAETFMHREYLNGYNL